MTGVIFDIKEFAINDGPGLGITVFLKGCPLRCKWCHNPEGLSFEPQNNLKTGKQVGQVWSDDELVAYLSQFKDAFSLSDGAVTFSGGEPTAQYDFLFSCCDKLQAIGIKVNIDTSGYCCTDNFKSLLRVIDWCYFDLKCFDPLLHEKMTGVSNELILNNARLLAKSNVRYHFRIPLIAQVSDTVSNRQALSNFLMTLPRQPESVDYLPFNTLAPAKYKNFNMKWWLEHE